MALRKFRLISPKPLHRRVDRLSAGPDFFTPQPETDPCELASQVFAARSKYQNVAHASKLAPDDEIALVAA